MTTSHVPGEAPRERPVRIREEINRFEEHLQGVESAMTDHDGQDGTGHDVPSDDEMTDMYEPRDLRGRFSGEYLEASSNISSAEDSEMSSEENGLIVQRPDWRAVPDGAVSDTGRPTVAGRDFRGTSAGDIDSDNGDVSPFELDASSEDEGSGDVSSALDEDVDMLADADDDAQIDDDGEQEEEPDFEGAAQDTAEEGTEAVHVDADTDADADVETDAGNDAEAEIDDYIEVDEDSNWSGHRDCSSSCGVCEGSSSEEDASDTDDDSTSCATDEDDLTGPPPPSLLRHRAASLGIDVEMLGQNADFEVDVDEEWSVDGKRVTGEDEQPRQQADGSANAEQVARALLNSEKKDNTLTWIFCGQYINRSTRDEEDEYLLFEANMKEVQRTNRRMVRKRLYTSQVDSGQYLPEFHRCTERVVFVELEKHYFWRIMDDFPSHDLPPVAPSTTDAPPSIIWKSHCSFWLDTLVPSKMSVTSDDCAGEMGPQSFGVPLGLDSLPQQEEETAPDYLSDHTADGQADSAQLIIYPVAQLLDLGRKARPLRRHQFRISDHAPDELFTGSLALDGPVEDHAPEGLFRQPWGPPVDAFFERSLGFAEFVKTHMSPTHKRVNAAGRIVSNPNSPPPTFQFEFLNKFIQSPEEFTRIPRVPREPRTAKGRQQLREEKAARSKEIKLIRAQLEARSGNPPEFVIEPGDNVDACDSISNNGSSEQSEQDAPKPSLQEKIIQHLPVGYELVSKLNEDSFLVKSKDGTKIQTVRLDDGGNLAFETLQPVVPVSQAASTPVAAPASPQPQPAAIAPPQSVNSGLPVMMYSTMGQQQGNPFHQVIPMMPQAFPAINQMVPIGHHGMAAGGQPIFGPVMHPVSTPHGQVIAPHGHIIGPGQMMTPHGQMIAAGVPHFNGQMITAQANPQLNGQMMVAAGNQHMTIQGPMTPGFQYSNDAFYMSQGQMTTAALQNPQSHQEAPETESALVVKSQSATRTWKKLSDELHAIEKHFTIHEAQLSPTDRARHTHRKGQLISQIDYWRKQMNEANQALTRMRAENVEYDVGAVNTFGSSNSSWSGIPKPASGTKLKPTAPVFVPGVARMENNAPIVGGNNSLPVAMGTGTSISQSTAAIVKAANGKGVHDGLFDAEEPRDLMAGYVSTADLGTAAAAAKANPSKIYVSSLKNSPESETKKLEIKEETSIRLDRPEPVIKEECATSTKDGSSPREAVDKAFDTMLRKRKVREGEVDAEEHIRNCRAEFDAMFEAAYGEKPDVSKAKDWICKDMALYDRPPEEFRSVRLPSGPAGEQNKRFLRGMVKNELTSPQMQYAVPATGAPAHNENERPTKEESGQALTSKIKAEVSATSTAAYKTRPTMASPTFRARPIISPVKNNYTGAYQSIAAQASAGFPVGNQVGGIDFSNAAAHVQSNQRFATHGFGNQNLANQSLFNHGFTGPEYANQMMPNPMFVQQQFSNQDFGNQSFGTRSSGDMSFGTQHMANQTFGSQPIQQQWSNPSYPQSTAMSSYGNQGSTYSGQVVPYSHYQSGFGTHQTPQMSRQPAYNSNGSLASNGSVRSNNTYPSRRYGGYGQFHSNP